MKLSVVLGAPPCSIPLLSSMKSVLRKLNPGTSQESRSPEVLAVVSIGNPSVTGGPDPPRVDRSHRRGASIARPEDMATASLSLPRGLPVDAGRLHGRRVDAVTLQPGDQLRQTGRRGAERTRLAHQFATIPGIGVRQ